MKTDFNGLKTTSPTEVVLTLLVLVLVATMLLAGAYLAGFIQLPRAALTYIGGALLAFVALGGFLIVHNCVKFMLKKG